jgi:hypothetical protein
MMIRVQLVNWNRPVFAVNSKRTYYYLGDVEGDPNTLAVLVDDPLGHERMLYCKKHKFVYAASAACQPCATQIQNKPNGAGVTPRDTP